MLRGLITIFTTLQIRSQAIGGFWILTLAVRETLGLQRAFFCSCNGRKCPDSDALERLRACPTLILSTISSCDVRSCRRIYCVPSCGFHSRMEVSYLYISFSLMLNFFFYRRNSLFQEVLLSQIRRQQNSLVFSQFVHKLKLPRDMSYVSDRCIVVRQFSIT